MSDGTDNGGCGGCLVIVGVGLIAGAVWTLWGGAYAALMAGVVMVLVAVCVGLGGK